MGLLRQSFLEAHPMVRSRDVVRVLVALIVAALTSAPAPGQQSPAPADATMSVDPAALDKAVASLRNADLAKLSK